MRRRFGVGTARGPAGPPRRSASYARFLRDGRRIPRFAPILPPNGRSRAAPAPLWAAPSPTPRIPCVRAVESPANARVRPNSVVHGATLGSGDPLPPVRAATTRSASRCARAGRPAAGPTAGPASTPTSRRRASVWCPSGSPASCGRKGSRARAGGVARRPPRCGTPTLAPRPTWWTEIPRRWAGPALGRRHHLRAHRHRLAVRGRGGGRLEPQGRGLGDGDAPARRTGRAGLGDGGRAPGPETVVHHSDQGTQYTSWAFGQRCEEAGLRPSTGSMGDAMCGELLSRRSNASCLTVAPSPTPPRRAGPSSTSSRASTTRVGVTRCCATARRPSSSASMRRSGSMTASVDGADRRGDSASEGKLGGVPAPRLPRPAAPLPVAGRPPKSPGPLWTWSGCSRHANFDHEHQDHPRKSTVHQIRGRSKPYLLGPLRATHGPS